jgi:hypothetical protein
MDPKLRSEAATVAFCSVKLKGSDDKVGSENAKIHKSLLFEHDAQQLTYCIRYTSPLSWKTRSTARKPTSTLSEDIARYGPSTAGPKTSAEPSRAPRCFIDSHKDG